MRSSLAAIGFSLLLGCSRELTPEQVQAELIQAASATIDQGLSHSDPWVRAESVRVIGLAENGALRGRISSALQDSEPIVRASAIDALLRQGDPAAETSTLATLTSGTREQKTVLLGLIAQNTRDPFRSEALLRAARDIDAEIRIVALDHLERIGIMPPQEDLTRLLTDGDARVVERAFSFYARARPDEALAVTMAGLRSSDADERRRAMQTAAYLDAPELWPAMRSIVANGDSAMAGAAQLALGRLGDPSVEDALRNTVLSGQGPAAARALEALSWIPSERARAQALRHKNDLRADVREAAFDVMVRLAMPMDEFATFLESSDTNLGRRALLYVQQRDPLRAAEILAATLANSEQPDLVLAATYRTSQTNDIAPLLRAARATLERLVSSPNETISALAMRLILVADSADSHRDALVGAVGDGARYSVLEASVGSESDWSGVYAAYLHDDRFFLRLAAAVGALEMGARFVPPLPGEGSAEL
jgi:HEAT repeat protein